MCICQFQASHQQNPSYQPVSLISFPCFSFRFSLCLCFPFFFLKRFLKARLLNAMNIALLHFLSSDGTTEESSISGKLYMLFAFIRWWGGGYPCKRQQYEHLKEKKNRPLFSVKLSEFMTEMGERIWFHEANETRRIRPLNPTSPWVVFPLSLLYLCECDQKLC